jgi:hypothetical protein
MGNGVQCAPPSLDCSSMHLWWSARNLNRPALQRWVQVVLVLLMGLAGIEACSQAPLLLRDLPCSSPLCKCECMPCSGVDRIELHSVGVWMLQPLDRGLSYVVLLLLNGCQSATAARNSCSECSLPAFHTVLP